MERCEIRTHSCRIILGTMFMFVLLLLCAGQAHAETVDSGTCGEGVTWTLDEEGTLTISGEGEIGPEYSWRACSMEIKELIINDGITEIGEAAFIDASELKRATFPGSLKTIGIHAFSGCKNLDVEDFPSSLKSIGYGAFHGCKSLAKNTGGLLNLPDYLEEIGDGAFAGCDSVTEIQLPGAKVGEGAFESCEGLTRVISKGYPEIGDNAFSWCKNLKYAWLRGATRIGARAFCVCVSLETVVMPDGLKRIEKDTFSSCDKLKEIHLPEGIEEIDDWAFGGCGSLPAINIPDSVKSIGSHAFFACYKLRDVQLPDSMEKIGDEVFAGCSSLQKVKWPSGMKRIGEMTLYGCTSLTDIQLPDNIEEIGENAFGGDRNLQTLKLPKDLKTIGNDAFFRCYALETVTVDHYTHWCNISFGSDAGSNPLHYGFGKLCVEDDADSVVFPEGITQIPAYTFRGNDKLTSIELPKSLEQVGAEAFDGCSGLKEVGVKNLASWCNTAFETAGSNPLNASADTVLQIGGGTGTKVNLPEGIKTIPDRTFAGWDMLREVTLPESIEKIGAGAFLGCKEIKTVNVASMGSWLNTKFATESSSPLAGGAQLRVKGGDTYNAVTELEADPTFGGIPSYAFSGTKTLKTAVIPEGVTQIGAGAFADCTGLAEVSLPETVTALEEKTFSGCKQLKKILIPQTITRIEYDAFSGCADDLIIYGYAGSEAESYANALGITFLPYTEYDAIRAGKLNDKIKWTLTGGTVLTIEGSGTTPDFVEGESPFAAFAGQVSTVKLKGITGLGDHLLQDFTNLKRVDVGLETKLNQISASAFSGCGDVEIRCYGSCYDTVSQAIASIPELSNLTAVKRSGSRLGNVTWTYNEDTGTILLTSNGADSFGESFTESPFAELKAKRVQFSDAFSCRDIPANLFKDCATISEVQLPQQVRTIGAEAFKGCANLQTLSWYGDIAQLGEGAFCDCSSLKEIRLEGSVMMDDQGREIKEETIEIPEQVKVIPADCFKGCSALRQVDWYEDPEEETTAGAIDAEAFLNCSALGDISIPDHVGAIGDRAFEGCENLTDRDFSENLQEIGAKAFYGCTRMKDIRFDGDLGAIGTKAIGYYNNNNKDEVQQGLRVVAPEDASNIKNYCSANGISFITSSGIIDGDPDQKVYVKIASSVTVKKGRSKSVKYSTNGKVKKVTSSGGGGIVSVTRSGSKIKFRGLRAGNATVHLTFKMKGAGNINKTVYVKVKKSSASLGDGEAQDISVKQKSLTFESDADSPKKLSVSGVQTSLLASLSKEGIAEVRVDDNDTVTVTPLRSGQVSLTLQAAEDDVFLASDKVSVGITVKARPARVTARAKKLSKKKARVTWKKISGATAYQIQVATKKNFKGKKTYKVKAGKTATLKKTVKLKKGKKNYIRVRYLCKGKYSKWSRTLTVKK